MKSVKLVICAAVLAIAVCSPAEAGHRKHQSFEQQHEAGYRKHKSFEQQNIVEQQQIVSFPLFLGVGY